MLSQRALHIVVVVVLVLGAFAGLTATAAAEPRPTSYILPGNAVFPEGVAFQQSTGDFFVSSTTDGTIYRGNVKEETASIFLPGGQNGRTSAAGLAVDDGRLYVSGGGTGKMFVYDIATKALLASFTTTRTPTFVNDVVVTKDGDAFFTDSLSPFLYRVYLNSQGQWAFEEWLNFAGTALTYVAGFNVNGIVATPDGKYLIVVQSNTGDLFRISLETKQVTKIDLGGATVMAGDGLLLKGHRLYVARNSAGLIAEVRLSGDYTSGKIVSQTSDPSFAFPTTIAEARGRLLVVNSQFDRRPPPPAVPNPVLPFTVSSVKLP